MSHKFNDILTANRADNTDKITNRLTFYHIRQCGPCPWDLFETKLSNSSLRHKSSMLRVVTPIGVENQIIRDNKYKKSVKGF